MDGGNEPVVKIGMKELYDAIVGLTNKFDVMVTQHTTTQNQVSDHEYRIRGLEKGRWPLPSVALLLSAVAVAVTLIID